MNNTISILLLPGGGVPEGGGGRGENNSLIYMVHRYFLLYLPPRPLGTPPPMDEGN